MRDGSSVSCPPLERITVADLFSIAKLKSLNFAWSDGDDMGEDFWVARQDREKLLQLAPRELFWYSLDQDPYRKPNPVWTMIFSQSSKESFARASRRAWCCGPYPGSEGLGSEFFTWSMPLVPISTIAFLPSDMTLGSRDGIALRGRWDSLGIGSRR